MDKIGVFCGYGLMLIGFTLMFHIHNSVERARLDAKRQAIAEMKERWDDIILRVSAQYGDRSAMLHHLKRELFGTK